MLEKVPNRHGPCKDKNCSFCCDPVAISHQTIINLGENKLPKDKKGDPLFINLKKFIYLKNESERSKLQTFECKNFDKETGLCKDYENRPNICRNTSCVNSNEKIKTEEDQYNEFKNKFEK